MKSLSGLGSVLASEPSLLWAGLFNAIVIALIVFAPRWGLMLTPPEQAAVGVVDAAVVSLIVRSQVTPTSSLASSK